MAAGSGYAGTRPLTSTAERAGLPLRGVDGRPLDLGAADWHTTDAAVSKQIALMQAANLAEIDKLNARLRKEYDAAKLENKRRQKELQAVTSELTTIERIVSGSDRTSGPIAAADATVTEYEAKIAAVQEQLTSAEHRSNMFAFMIERLRDETKDMDLAIDTLNRQLKGVTAQQEEASLLLHQTASQRTRSAALAHTLARHMEAARTQRSGKLARVEETLAEQHARLRAYDEREQRRLNLSSMPRGDLDEDGEDRLKQLFLVRKIYNNMLSRRLRDDQRRTDRLSQAYQRIRTATGLEDVTSIILKYQTRDATVATLQAQMKAARDRVDTLSAERRTLVWALDEAQTLGASALESRALYNSVEENDRRHAEGARRVRESRERLNRLSVVLEECRACLVKLLERVGINATAIVGVVAGTAGAPPPDSPGKAATSALRAADDAAEGEAAGAGAAAPGDGPAAGAGAGAAGAGRRRGSFGGGAGAAGASRSGARPTTPSVGARGGSAGGASAVDGTLDDEVAGFIPPGAVMPAPPTSSGIAKKSVKAVQPDQLEHALSQLEQRVSQLLAHLAAVFEREEAAFASTTKSKGAKARRGVLPSGASSAVGGASRSAVAALETTATAVTESDAAAHRMSVAALSEKASMRVFQRLMTLPPDVSERNVRINARAPSPEPAMSVLTAAAALPVVRVAGGAAAGEVGPAAAVGPASGAGAVGGGGATTSADEVASAMHKSAADLSKLLHGSGAGSVVDRVSLKRLSAMVAHSMGHGSGGGGAGAHGRRPVGGRTLVIASAVGVVGGGGGGDGGASPRYAPTTPATAAATGFAPSGGAPLSPRA